MANGPRATDAAFDALHALLVEAQADGLARNLRANRLPRMIVDPTDEAGKRTIPNPEWEPLDTKLLAVIRATLKDNGIDVPATSKRFDSLVGQLKDLDLDDVAASRPN